MVRIVDDGSHFDAPIEKVWKLVEAHGEHFEEIHPDVRNPKMSPAGPNQGVVEWVHEEGGMKMPMKIRITTVAPTGQVIEFLEGPLAGSTVFNYYTAKGQKTGVTAIGDFKSAVLPGPQLEAAAHQFLDSGFDADSAYLRRMK
jgi:hypothetical protein